MNTKEQKKGLSDNDNTAKSTSYCSLLLNNRQQFIYQ